VYSDIDFITTQGVLSEESLAGLADKVNTPGDIAAPATIANIEGAITRADEWIDSYLRAVYDGTLPLASPPGVIRTASAEVACYLLWQSTSCPHDENPLRGRYEHWERWLKDLARGTVVLGLDSGDTNTSFATGYSRTYADRRFSPDTLKGVF
jgi:phage gp36-like protein